MTLIMCANRMLTFIKKILRKIISWYLTLTSNVHWMDSKENFQNIIKRSKNNSNPCAMAKKVAIYL